MRRDTWQALRSRVVFVNAPLERSESDSSARIGVSILREISIGIVQIFQYRYLSKYRYFWQHYRWHYSPVCSPIGPMENWPTAHSWWLWRWTVSGPTEWWTNSSSGCTGTTSMTAQCLDGCFTIHPIGSWVLLSWCPFWWRYSWLL